jgi:hypothetical protein
MIRQGDLLFIPSSIPVGTTEVEDGVVARGEATGHNHRIRSRAEGILLMLGTAMYIKALRETPIDHEEHKTVTLPVGDWRVQRQREYQPDGWRQVAD